MTGPLQMLLTAGPLALYLYILAVWQGGRHPRIVSGRTDAGLLTFGIGGLPTFGPFGQVVAAMLFGAPRTLHWLALTAATVLLGALLVRRSAHRMVIYHVDPEALDNALADVLDLRTGCYVRRIGGFEDRTGTHVLLVQTTPLLGAAAIEAIGEEPERAIRDLEARLRARLERAPTPSTRVAGILFGLSALTLLISMTGMFLMQPRTREVLRVLIERLQGE